MEEEQKPILFVILIHGTFAPKSSWTQQGSPLRSKIRKDFENDFDVQFVRHEWGAGNSDKDRVQGATVLRERIIGIYEPLNGTDCQFVLVAHSHGSDVALRTASQLSHRNIISAIVTFHSPFISTMKRDFVGNLKFFGNILHLIVALIFLASIPLLFSILGSGVTEDNSDFILFLSATSSALIILPWIIKWWRRRLVRKREETDEFTKKNSHRPYSVKQDLIQNYASRNQDIHPPVLVFNSTGDEALAGLQILSVFLNLPFVFMSKILIAVMTMLVFIVIFHDISAYRTIANSTDIIDNIIIERFIEPSKLVADINRASKVIPDELNNANLEKRRDSIVEYLTSDSSYIYRVSILSNLFELSDCAGRVDEADGIYKVFPGINVDRCETYTKMLEFTNLLNPEFFTTKSSNYFYVLILSLVFTVTLILSFYAFVVFPIGFVLNLLFNRVIAGYVFYVPISKLKKYKVNSVQKTGRKEFKINKLTTISRVFFLLFSTLFLRKVIGAVPYKTGKFEYIDTGISSTWLNHSVAYDDPIFLEKMSSWLANCIRNDNLNV